MYGKETKIKNICIIIALITLTFMFSACITAPDKEPSFTTGDVTTLTLDTNADGAITSSNREQWFKFTATTTTQYITITYGTLTSVFIQLYDKDGNTFGGQRSWGPVNPPYSGTIGDWTLTRGRVYYIKIAPNPNSSSGTYRIMFSNSQLSPEVRQNAVVLTNDVWTDGAISEGSQTYQFIASANTQHFHVKFGTLANMYLRFYDKDGIMLGRDYDDVHLTGTSNSNTTFTQMLSVGQRYYVRVFTADIYSGTYQIAFNNRPLPPGTLETAVTLPISTWLNGNLTSNTDQNWYRFTSTASTHYIHVNFGTLTNIYVRLYDHTGNTLGDWMLFSGNTRYRSLLVSSGQVYYLRVQTPSSGGHSGTYQIAVNTSITPP